MPVKKKVDTTKNTDNTEDDKKSVSTESDIESGTFSQYDEEEVKEEDNEEELVSDSENVEDEIVDAEDEIEEGEEEQAADTEEVKPKKKKSAKKTVVINNDCLYNNIDFEEDYDEKDEQIPDNKRITINRLTKYERVRIIGIRAKQIMTGANILLRGIENKTPSEIAELELKHNMVPFKIKRRLPNGRYEVWKLSELEK
jgi:DNA-directed RNA polymerase subunit K/omega